MFAKLKKMTPFKKLFSSILLVLTSFVSFAQDEIVSYSYSGATEDTSYYYNWRSTQNSYFSFLSCKDFSLTILFSADKDYRIDDYELNGGDYSYNPTTKTMQINFKSHLPGGSSWFNYCGDTLHIIEFHIDAYDSLGNWESTLFEGEGTAKSNARADSIWFVDDGGIISGDTIKSCEIFGSGFQIGTKINDDRFSGGMFDNLFTGPSKDDDCYDNNKFDVLVNGVVRSDFFYYMYRNNSHSLSNLNLKDGDTVEVVKREPSYWSDWYTDEDNPVDFIGKSTVSDVYCHINIPEGTSTGIKILKILPNEKVNLIDTLISHELCEGEKLKFFPNLSDLVDNYEWELVEGKETYGNNSNQDTLTVEYPSTYIYFEISDSSSLNDCPIYDQVSVVTENDCKGKISGRVYDGTYSNRIEGVLVQTNTGEVGISDSLGNYTILFDKSNSPTHVFIADLNYRLDSNSLSFVSDTFLLARNENLKTYRLFENDLKITMQSGRNRPGFTIPQYITIHNISKTDITTDVRVDIDPQLTYVETTNGGNPTSVSGNTITWENITVPSGEIRRYTYTAKLDRLTELGSELNNIAILFDNSPDNNLLNDTVDYTPVVTGSYDPNDKNAVYFGPSNGNYIHDSTNFEYKIRFQNTGTDTAFTVVVKDKITSKLDLTTFQMVDASHDYSVSIVEDTLVWTFNNILLVDSNTNEPGSHGFIRFRIDQAEGNVDFDEIKNKAFIFFDYNDPIITNEFTSIVHDDLTVNAIEINHDVKVYPNPTSGILNIEGINSGTLSVSNVIGERVLFQEASAEDFGNINLENLPTGLYMLTISSGNKISTIKVVKK